MLNFRDLTAEDIECRVSTVSEKGCSLLLYKDARCDMNILDETVGPENWQRRHTRENANCIVSIWCEQKKQWIEKEDTGTESYTEKEKGQASDSFKRACFNWGIGRELYTAPFIWIGSDKCAIQKKQNGQGFTTFDRFAVAEIEIQDKKITKLSIMNAKTGEICYKWSKNGKVASSGSKKQDKPAQKATQPPAPPLTEESRTALNTAITGYVNLTGTNINEVMVHLKKGLGKSHKEYTEADAKKALELISNWQNTYMNDLGV